MRGFPFVIGTDIVQISRFDPTANPRRIQRLAARFLHPKELSCLKARFPSCYTLLSPSDPAHSSGLQSANNSSSTNKLLENLPNTHGNPNTHKLQSWLAGRWAAKEAARKAWGAEIIGYKDVRVEVRESSSKSSSASISILCEPFSGPTKGKDGESELSEGRDGPITGAMMNQPSQEGALSISHDGDYVVATVLAEPLAEELRSLFQNRSESTQETPENTLT